MKRIKRAAIKQSIKAVPKKESPDTMRLPKGLKDKILQQAEKENKSFSTVVITILNDHYEKRQR